MQARLSNRSVLCIAGMTGASVTGIGPATAGAIMSMISPENTCFMGDEAMGACRLQFRYNAKTYGSLLQAMTKKAKELGPEWRVADVERALFGIAMKAPLLAARANDDTSAATATATATGIKATATGIKATASSAAGSAKREADNETDGNSGAKKQKLSSTWVIG